MVVPLEAGLNPLPVPVAPRATAAPGMRLLKVSRTVTVMSDALDPLLAVIVPADAVSVDLLPAGVVPGVMLKGPLVMPAKEPDAAVRV